MPKRNKNQIRESFYNKLARSLAKQGKKVVVRKKEKKEKKEAGG